MIALLTDFGLDDWFVGTMKAVILAVHPAAQIIDISHGIPAGNIVAGSVALAASARFFPAETIFVAVVDPGVGGDRKPIAVKTGSGLFVGPDNGLLNRAVESAEIREIRVLSNLHYCLPDISSTFHGRDVFAPVAGHLGRGVGFSEIGATQAGLKSRDPVPHVRWSATRIEGQVIYIDHFGNAITNISGMDLEPDWARPPDFRVAGGSIRSARCYSDAPVGAPVAVLGSTGFWEIAVNGGRAADWFGLKQNSAIMVERTI